ncbi:MAG TPA: hypothetical protein V6D11_27530 [Waterburya sp.]
MDSDEPQTAIAKHQSLTTDQFQVFRLVTKQAPSEETPRLPYCLCLQAN